MIVADWDEASLKFIAISKKNLLAEPVAQSDTKRVSCTSDGRQAVEQAFDGDGEKQAMVQDGSEQRLP